MRQANTTPASTQPMARFPHPAIHHSGNAIAIRLPIEARPLYRAATAVIGGRSVSVWFVRPSVLPPQDLERLRSIIRQAQLVEHPNLAPVYGLTSWYDPLISWPRVRETLADLLHNGHYRRQDAAALMAPIAGALAVAHEERLIHGYLDPAQIAVQDGVPTVMGVGIWSCLDHQMAAARFRGEEAETIAPEVLAGEKLSSRSDCYSVAMIFARLLTGNEALGALAARRLFEHMGLPVLTAALATDPDQRNEMKAIAAEFGRLDRQHFYLPEPEENAARALTENIVPPDPPPVSVRRTAPDSRGSWSPLNLFLLAVTLLAVAALAFYLASTF